MVRIRNHPEQAKDGRHGLSGDLSQQHVWPRIQCLVEPWIVLENSTLVSSGISTLPGQRRGLSRDGNKAHLICSELLTFLQPPDILPWLQRLDVIEWCWKFLKPTIFQINHLPETICLIMVIFFSEPVPVSVTNPDQQPLLQRIFCGLTLFCFQKFPSCLNPLSYASVPTKTFMFRCTHLLFLCKFLDLESWFFSC